MTLPHAFLHAHIKNLNFYVWSPCTRECARGRNTKGKGFFLSLFVSSLYIRAFCLQLIIDVKLNSNWRQREKLSKKKPNQIAAAVIPTEQPPWDCCALNPSSAAFVYLTV